MASTDPATWPNSAEESIAAFIAGIRKVGAPPTDPSGTPSPTAFKTPYSLQDIKSGATAISKGWAALIAAAGGLPALGAILAGYWKGFVGTDDNGTIRAALAIGGSVLLAVTALSVALIVRGDVASRAMAHAARAHAEGQIIAAALANYQFAQTPTVASAPYLIQKVDGTFLPVSDINFADEKWFVSVGDAVVPTDQIKALISGTKIRPAT